MRTFRRNDSEESPTPFSILDLEMGIRLKPLRRTLSSLRMKMILKIPPARIRGLWKTIIASKASSCSHLSKFVKASGDEKDKNLYKEEFYRISNNIQAIEIKSNK